MRDRLRGLGTAMLAGAALAVVPAGAVAAPASNTFAVRGVETAFTSTSATFLGTGTGIQGDRAAWTTTLTRTRFDSVGQSTITGGTLGMKTINPSWATDWVTGTGTFSGELTHRRAVTSVPVGSLPRRSPVWSPSTTDARRRACVPPGALARHRRARPRTARAAGRARRHSPTGFGDASGRSGRPVGASASASCMNLAPATGFGVYASDSVKPNWA